MCFWKNTRVAGVPSVCASVVVAVMALVPLSARGVDRPAASFVLPAGPAKPGFDLSRFNYTLHGAFESFVVTSTLPVREALNARKIASDTDVLVTTTAGGPVALVTEQMAYHHIAQGRTGGQDWLVSFCVVCNTATRLVPKINGAVARFITAGAYDGLMVMQDDVTRTIWNHVTGEALYGPAVGTTIGPPGNVLHVTVKQLLASAPDARIAISDRVYFAGGRRHGTVEGISLLGRRHGRPDERTGLSDIFIATLGAEDKRRPRMDLGLGIWWDGGSRYYPRELLRQRGGALIDNVNGRPLLVYIDPGTSTPAAMFVNATQARVEGSVVKLDQGLSVRDGALLNSQGRRSEAERPQQLFTRWYGFALTFPGASVYPGP